MFCTKCGKKIPDVAKFCPGCGTPVKQSTVVPAKETIPAKMTVSNGVLDREALKVYIENLHTLEFAGVAIRNKLNAYQKAVEELSVYKKVYPNFPIVFMYDGQNIRSLMGYFNKIYRDDNGIKTKVNLNLFMPDPSAGFISRYLSDEGYSFDAEPVTDIVEKIRWHRLKKETREINYFGRRVKVQDYYYENESSQWEDINKFGEKWNKDVFSLFDPAEPYLKVDGKSVYICRDDARKQFFEDFDDFSEKCREGFEKNQKERIIKSMSLPTLKKSLEKQKKLLDDAYSINIIPSMFRNIYAIHYIYEFITTSNESLSNVLMHYNLETVKQKLDNILEKQSVIITQNAFKISQNNALLAQNQQMLNRLASIEANTEIAAEYGRINEINTDIIIWLQTMDILFK